MVNGKSDPSLRISRSDDPGAILWRSIVVQLNSSGAVGENGVAAVSFEVNHETFSHCCRTTAELDKCLICGRCVLGDSGC